MDETYTRYVIKTPNGYVTCHRRGRMTRHIESARTFKTYRGARSNRFADDQNIIQVEISLFIPG